MASDFLEEDDWREFFSTLPKPSDLEEKKEEIVNFAELQRTLRRKVVLVTSGGTTVPLEHNTVRFVDNFSAGTRGSASAEYFLQHGYAVIFLHRLKSLLPFIRHLSSDESNMLEALHVKLDDDGKCRIEISEEYVPKVKELIERYHQVKLEKMLLQVSFTTLSDYLWLLRLASEALAASSRQAMLYLAAAVSDFYIPPNEMATHKIESDAPLSIHLHIVPKMLRPLVKHWVPEAYVVSFKLETNESVLVSKARKSLEKYGHELVIANLLHNRKTSVILVTATSQFLLQLSPHDAGKEIEQYIVEELVVRHQSHMD